MCADMMYRMPLESEDTSATMQLPKPYVHALRILGHILTNSNSSNKRSRERSDEDGLPASKKAKADMTRAEVEEKQRAMMMARYNGKLVLPS